MKLNKETLICEIITQLKTELLSCEQAANNAHLAATDDQSVAETQYDTLAIESAYLAEGQSRRIIECHRAIKTFEQLKSTIHSIDCKKITEGNLVQIGEDEAKKHWFFLAPAAAGYRTTLSNQCITVITRNAPIGKMLMGKSLDDIVHLTLANNQIDDEITSIL